MDVTDGKDSKSNSFQVIIEQNQLLSFIFLAAGGGGWSSSWGTWGGWGGGDDRERREEEKEMWKGAFVSLAEGVPRMLEDVDLLVQFRFSSVTFLEDLEDGKFKVSGGGDREGVFEQVLTDDIT